MKYLCGVCVSVCAREEERRCMRDKEREGGREMQLSGVQCAAERATVD